MICQHQTLYWACYHVIANADALKANARVWWMILNVQICADMCDNQPFDGVVDEEDDQDEDEIDLDEDDENFVIDFD